MSIDNDDTADIISLIGVSAASTFWSTFRAFINSKVGFIDGSYILNPGLKDLENPNDMVVAGSTDAVFMVESKHQNYLRIKC